MDTIQEQCRDALTENHPTAEDVALLFTNYLEFLKNKGIINEENY